MGEATRHRRIPQAWVHGLVQRPLAYPDASLLGHQIELNCRVKKSQGSKQRTLQTHCLMLQIDNRLTRLVTQCEALIAPAVCSGGLTQGLYKIGHRGNRQRLAGNRETRSGRSQPSIGADPGHRLPTIAVTQSG